MTFARQQLASNRSEKKRETQNARFTGPARASQHSTASLPFIQRKASCVCGGSCPRCKQQSANLPISQPNDASEIEADRMAEKVMRMPKSQTSVSSDAGNQKSGNTFSQIRPQSEGKPLPESARAFFEPRFGQDLSGVRVHIDATAASQSERLNAEAFTVGNHIMFGPGRFNPDSEQGRFLMAHELTHYIQQQRSGPQVNRRLVVNSSHPSGPPVSAPATDPAASLTPATRLSMMDSIITSLCPDFIVDSGTGEVLNNSGADRATLAGGSAPTGCCCLAILADAANTWTIDVSQVLGPHTIFAGRHVVLSPTSTPIEFGSFTSGGSLAFQGQVPAAGHELCGHAALEELSVHPTGNRLTTNVHDPTVNIENLISTEQGVPASDLRGLAASGTHRGESVDRITVSQYPLNGTDPSTLPVSEQNKLNFAAEYAKANNGWVDILGHSDSTGSSAAKLSVSKDRAKKAKDKMVAAPLSVPTTITKHGLAGVPRFTRVEGLSDTQLLPPPATDADQRRVEILIAGFPAGAQVPPVGTPTTVTPITTPAGALVTPADPCEAALIGGAFPPP
jgi:hypothetical protein